MNTKIKKIDYAIFHDPNLIPILLRDCSINNGLIYSRLRRAVPRRVGIEFECIGNPAQYYYDTFNAIKSPGYLKVIYNLLDYSQDLSITRGSSNIILSSSNTILSGNDTDKFNEMRVSIKNYSQLRGLYNILKLFKDSCIKPIGGGIHIHIDFSDYTSKVTRVLASKYIKNHLKEVENIFPKYLGSYNKRVVGIEQKGTYVNLSCHESIEFRIAPLTFEYDELIKWIVDCNKFVTKMIHECHLKSDYELSKSKCIIGCDTNPNEYSTSDLYRLLIRSINTNTSDWSYWDQNSDQY